MGKKNKKVKRQKEHSGECSRESTTTLLYKLLVEIVIVGALLSTTVEFASEGYVDVFLYCPFGEQCSSVAEAGVKKIEIAIVCAWLMFGTVSAIVLYNSWMSNSKSKAGGRL